MPPTCPFASAKRTILHKLQTSVDYSPKGSIDAKAYDLVWAVNRCVEYVTTSSCSGRIALYCHDGKGGEEVVDVEGGTVGEDGVLAGNRGGSSSKGSGRWLLVDHEGSVAATSVACALGEAWEGSTVVLKVEPFILHVQAKDMGSAVRLLGVAIRAGYRESGIVLGSSGRGKVVVAVRSTAGGMDAPLQWAGTPIMPVWEGGVVGGALHPAFLTLIAAANERFALVESRRSRFVAEFLEECTSHGVPQEMPATAPTTSEAATSEGDAALCSVCGATFPSRNRLFKHLVEGVSKRVCPKSLLPPPLASKHTCRGCATPFPSGNALFKHVQVCPPAIALKAGPPPPSSPESVEAREQSRALLCRSAGGRHKLLSGDDLDSELVRFLPPLSSLRRWGHCAALLPLAFPPGVGGESGSMAAEEKEVVVVFGGCGGDGLHGRRSDAVCLLPWSGSVVNVEVEEGGEGEGVMPAPRVRATLTAVALPPTTSPSSPVTEVALLLLGGHNGPSHVLGDAWLLRLKVAGGRGGESSPPRISGKWTPLWTHPTPSPLPSTVHPCPRYGHTCEPEGKQGGGYGSGVLLFGGRSYTESFGDCWRFALERGSSEGEYTLSTPQLLSSPQVGGVYGVGAPVPRFSHASTVIPSQLGGVYLLVQGGYRSPLSPTSLATDEEGGAGGPPGGGGETQPQILSDFWALHVPSPTTSGVVNTPGKWTQLSFTPLPSASSSALVPFKRFSHTMTQLRGGSISSSSSSSSSSMHSILIVGGECCDPQWNAPFVFHINDSHLGALETTTATTTTTSTLPLLVPTQWLLKSTGLGYGVATVSPIVPLPSTASGIAVANSGAPGLTPLLPICHTAHATRDGRVYIIGGGGVCFAFGSMYSHSLCLEPPAFRGVLGQQQQEQQGGRGVAPSHPGGTCSLTLSSKVAEGVKKELQACGWYDWSRKVGQVVAVGGEKALGVPITAEGYERLLPFTQQQKGGMSGVPPPTLPPSLIHAMALPSTLLSSHCPHLPQFSPQENDGGPASMHRASTAVLHLLQSTQGRLWLASSGVVVVDVELGTLIHELCEVGGQGDRGFPSKVEWLSDILILPSNSFTSPSWAALLSSAAAGGVGPALLWDTLAGVFHTERVGKGGEVSPGGTRASQLSMLRTPTPPPGSYSLPPAQCLDKGDAGERGEGVAAAAAAGVNHGAPPPIPPPSSIPVGYGGWVEVKEGGLTYTFDATRVMFSSGNVTEKARMGGLSVQGETIVDLYAGIGYFTLPLLAKGKPGKMHAVEWNTDALACLAINVHRVGGFEGGRVSLWPGDNTTLLTRHPHLRGCADRVLLGLIPSSLPGWPTALGVLKPEGGMLHVHENVREGEAEDWARGTLLPELVRLAEAGGSVPWTFTLKHIERVKGYAPRVAHFVFDVRVRRRS